MLKPIVTCCLLLHAGTWASPVFPSDARNEDVSQDLDYDTEEGRLLPPGVLTKGLTADAKGISYKTAGIYAVQSQILITSKTFYNI